MNRSDGQLTAELERMLVRELVAEWRRINASYFKDALRAPALALVVSRAHLGRWHGQTRTLEISRPLVLAHPWGAVVEVLKHEMAHQYVDEVLKVKDESAHGNAFREVCTRWGIDASAAGVPEAKSEGDARSRVIERVARLLALAESPNVHEAEAAMAAAQRLMLKYNVELQREGATKRYGFRHLGEPSGRVAEADRVLASILAKHFFVEVIWVPVYRALEGKRGSVLEICGTPGNLEMAEYVHAFLTHTAEQLWIEHRSEHGIEGNRDRRVFLAGVMAGFADKLARDQKGHTKAGLVWVKDAQLDGFFRRRHPYVRHVRHAGQRKNEAFGHGREAGRRIVLRRGVNAAPASHGRLLPAKASAS